MVDEKNLNVYEDGNPKKISPSTEAKTVSYKDKSLSDLLDANLPVRLTRQEYIAKINSGEITANTETIYEIIDDEEGIGINDSFVSEASTFSSKKILEMIATLGKGGTIILGNDKDKDTTSKTITIDLSPTRWEGDGPYTQTVVLNDINKDSIIEISLSSRLNEADYLLQSVELAKSSIRRINHENNKLIFNAFIKKPENHIIVDAIIQK